MKLNTKKSCCGCFSFILKKKPNETPKEVEGIIQTNSPNPQTSLNPIPEKAKSESHFYPKLTHFALPGMQGFRTTIITGHGLSTSMNNESKEYTIRTPIAHNLNENQPDNPVPQIFEDLERRINSKGLPSLKPVTPARGFRLRTQLNK